MLRMRVGIILVGIGAALALSGVVGLVIGEDPEASAATDEASPAVTTAADQEATTSTTAQVATTPASTVPPTTTTTTAATTTTIAPGEAIGTFITEFGAAIANGDVEWLFDHLNPAMPLEYGEDVCRGFISTDILALTEYTLTGEVAGPETKTFETGVGTLTIDNVYTADTSFVFQGQQFDAKADFVYEDTVTWLAVCR